MKNLKISFILFLLSVMSFAQVGIGTNTPETSSVLELKSADKALLLTRVATTAAVTSPVNGMMVYDISTNCIKGYQNGAWTDCLSSCANDNTSGASCFPWETQLRFKDIYTVNKTIGQSLGVTTNGNIFIWGSDSTGSIDYDGVPNPANVISTSGTASAYKESPVYMPGAAKWDGIAVKVRTDAGSYAALDALGNIWAWGSQSWGSLGDGVISGTNRFPAYSVVKPSGVTKFMDVYMQYGRMVVLGDNGKIYYVGRNQTNAPTGSTTTFIAIPNPSGVSGTFKYLKFWSSNENNQDTIYMLGDDGNIYSTGKSKHVAGNASAIANPLFPSNIYKVNFPAGVAQTITKIDANFEVAFALTASGQMYTWGQISRDDADMSGQGFNCVNSKLISYAGLINSNTLSGASGTYILDPRLMLPPTGETSFIDMTAAAEGHFFIGNSGKLYATGTEVNPGETGVYFKTDSNPLSSDPSANGWFKDYILVDATACLTLSKVHSQLYAILVADSSGRVSGFGLSYNCNVGGKGCVQKISTAIPPLNGNLDYNNPRPQTLN